MRIVYKIFIVYWSARIGCRAREFKLQRELFDHTDHKLVVEAVSAAKSLMFTNINGGLGLAAERGSSSCRESFLKLTKLTPRW